MAIFYPLILLPVFNTIALSSLLPPTISSPLPSSGPWSYTGVPPELARVGEPGTKQVCLHTRRTPAPSSGVATGANVMSSSTSSEAALTSVTCFAGWTGTQSRSKRRVRPQHCGPLTYGLHRISPLQSGSRFWMQQQLRRCYDD